MSLFFSADEIFEMAEQIERNGAMFYRAAADKFSSMRQLLLDLAAMEDEHEKTFAAMRTQLTGEEQQSDVFDPDGQAQMYLRSFSDGHVFDIKADPVEQLGALETPEDLLKKAIELEKDSIVFYIGLKELVPPKAGKSRVQTIIEEEMRHVAVLHGKLVDLK